MCGPLHVWAAQAVKCVHACNVEFDDKGVGFELDFGEVRIKRFGFKKRERLSLP